MKQRYHLDLVADFETSIYEGQTETEVWAAAVTAVGNTDPDKVVILNSIDSFMEWIFSCRRDLRVYFHNLKFDGTFILDWLLRHKEWVEFSTNDKMHLRRDCESYEIPNSRYTYVISDMGVWYSIKIKHHGCLVEFRDSYKLIPFSVKKIGKDFKTRWQKSSIEYVGERHGGGEISAEEQDYIKRDVLVVSEALQMLFDMGLKGMTIGACCLKEWKVLRYGPLKSKQMEEAFRAEFPLLNPEVEEFIRKSYKGGWCYVHKPGKARCGYTADINSSYPFNMHSSSGHYYPIGEPHYFKVIDDVPIGKISFIKVRIAFELKKGKVPCIQIKGDARFRGTEWLSTSKSSDHLTYHIVEMVVTDKDWKLINECYDLIRCDIVEGYWFDKAIGLFDEYIDKWITIKQQNKGAIRTIAKLMLNNLYGKFAASSRSDYKMYRLQDDRLVSFRVEDNSQEPGYIPIGSMITSCARDYVIRTALIDVDHFHYADTDSIHCECSPLSFQFDIDAKRLGAWDIESVWDEAYFSGQKRYIEHTIDEDYVLRCAGMTPRLREQFIEGLRSGKYIMEDFRSGLELWGSLKATVIKGGTILRESSFIMR